MKVYMVGGCVRDMLLNRTASDVDYVVVGATDQNMIDMGFTCVGNEFSVYLHPMTGDEYALARTERKVGTGYTGFETDVSSSITIEQDLYRRDLTINAMAIEVFNWGGDKPYLSEEIIDPYGGMQDLKNKTLRHVSEAFAEDPLRVLRVARFSARYNFKIAPETIKLMQQLVDSNQLLDLTPERVYKELRKALQEPFTERFFETLHRIISDPTDYYFLPRYFTKPYCFKANADRLPQLFHMVNNTEFVVPLKLSLLDYTTEQLDQMKVPNADRLAHEWVHHPDHQYVFLIGFDQILTNNNTMERFVRTLQAFKVRDHLSLIKQTFFVQSLLTNWYYTNDPSILLLRKLSNTDILDNMIKISAKDVENADQYVGKQLGEQIVKARAQFLKFMLQ